MTRCMAWCAAAIVLAAVAWQQAIGPRKSADRERAARIERALAAHDWDDATQIALAGLDIHPEERRLYWYLCHVSLQKGLPQLALQHLSLATAPMREGARKPVYPVPTRDETDAALRSIRDGLGTSALSPTDRLRLARIMGARGDEAACIAELRNAASLARTDSPHYGTAARAFIAATVHLNPDRTAQLDDREIGRALATLAGAVDTSAGASIAAFAGGSYFQGKHYFMIGENAIDTSETEDTWLCIVTGPARTKGPKIEALRLDPLSGEAQTIGRWLEEIPKGAIAFGMVSPEAIARTSKVAIDAWRELAGLVKVPSPQWPKPYAFILERTDDGWRAIERPAIAPDMPAIVICAGPGR